MTAIRQAFRLGGWTAALLCVTAVGCGKIPKPVDVTGKVVFFGARPKAPLLISLHPQEDANKMSTPSALIDASDGSFKLEKCLPGRYKATVAVVPVQVGGGPPGAPAPPRGFRARPAFRPFTWTPRPARGTWLCRKPAKTDWFLACPRRESGKSRTVVPRPRSATSLSPRSRLPGTHCRRGSASRLVRSAGSPPGSSFPCRAWERDSPSGSAAFAFPVRSAPAPIR